MARLLLWRLTVVATSRSTALVTLALAGVAMSARVATADSINLLRPAALTAPIILFDQVHGPWKSDDEATAAIDQDCVAVNDRARDTRQPAITAVNWRGAHPAFQWEPPAEPAIVYVVCVDHPRGGSSPGGMQLSAALSWSAQPAAAVFRRDAFTTAIGVAFDSRPRQTEPIGSPDAAAPWASSEPPPSWPADPPLNVPLDPPIDLPIPIGPSNFPAPNPTTPFDPPIFLDAQGGNPPIDPGEMIPTPEPATWLLMGTGLVVAWHAARRKNR